MSTETKSPGQVAYEAFCNSRGSEPAWTRIDPKGREAWEAAGEAARKPVEEEVENREAAFELRWRADMRAIKRWQEAGPGRELTQPDHADLCVWLLEQLDKSEVAAAAMRAALLTLSEDLRADEPFASALAGTAGQGWLSPEQAAELQSKVDRYEPENCHWATVSEQARNRGSNRMLTHDGKTMCISDWSTERGIKWSTIAVRIKRGWTVADALETPPQIRRPKT